MICVISGSNYMVGIRLVVLGLFNYETLSSLGFVTFDQCRTLWQLVGDFGIGFGHDGGFLTPNCVSMLNSCSI